MVAFRVVQPSDALRFINFATLVLLFSMMLIVGVLHLVGFFEWNAEMVLRGLKPPSIPSETNRTDKSSLCPHDHCPLGVCFVYNARLSWLPFLYVTAIYRNTDW